MASVNIEEIKSNTTKSIFFLSLRNFGIQAVSTIGFFLLTLILGTGEVGLFAIVSETVAILGYFSDVGLASALIQQKEEIDEISLKTTFTIQQVLVFIALIIVIILYPSVASYKNYGFKETAIFASLCFSFFMASLKTIPSVLLERKLNFAKISSVDIAENISFYLFAVLFAFFGFEGYSYAIAVLIRSVIGVIMIYRLSPWKIGFGYSSLSLQKLFRFGIPFQINSFIALAKDRLSNILVAGIIGREAFGIISWSQKVARIPLSFMDAVMKVSFPTFSRLQNEPNHLSRSIEKSLMFIAFLVFPILAGISMTASDFINLIPKYNKWLPAVQPLYFYSFSFAIAAVTTPLTNAFNSVGKILTTTKFMIMWTILTWIFYPTLSIKFGFVGTAIASVFVGLSSIVVWISAKKHFGVDVFQSIKNPLLASLFMIICLFFVGYLSLPVHILLSLKIIIGIFSYSIPAYLFSKNELLWFWQQRKWLQKK